MGKRAFLSYARADGEAATALADGLTRGGFDVWMDGRLEGGQDWWDEILREIRANDYFVLAVSPSSLDSVACQSEYSHATALRRTILPVEVAPIESERLLDERLGRTQRVHFDRDDGASILDVVRALLALPEPPPPPDDVALPELPISYLGRLRNAVHQSSDLSFDEQRSIASQLVDEYGRQGPCDEIIDLAIAMAARRDVLLSVAAHLDEQIIQPGADSRRPPQPTADERSAVDQGSTATNETSSEATVDSGASLERPDGRRPKVPAWGAVVSALAACTWGLATANGPYVFMLDPGYALGLKLALATLVAAPALANVRGAPEPSIVWSISAGSCVVALLLDVLPAVRGVLEIDADARSVELDTVATVLLFASGPLLVVTAVVAALQLRSPMHRDDGQMRWRQRCTIAVLIAGVVGYELANSDAYMVPWSTISYLWLPPGFVGAQLGLVALSTLLIGLLWTRSLTVTSRAWVVATASGAAAALFLAEALVWTEPWQFADEGEKAVRTGVVPVDAALAPLDGDGWIRLGYLVVGLAYASAAWWASSALRAPGRRTARS